MINDLLKNWHLRTKYVDDTAVSEILPRNSISLLDFAVRDIHDYCTEHKMKLNPKKCKEMVFNFMKNPNTVTRPLHIENSEVERVFTYKMLGVIISDGLKWNCRIDYIITKAVLRLLKRTGVQAQDMLKKYRCNVRSILEYALQVWQNIPVCLSKRIEAVQKRAFKIIYPGSSYNQALILGKEATLSSRRQFLCNKLMADMNKNSDHPLSFLVSAPENITIPYNLRSGAVRPITKLRRTKRTEVFFTFKYQ